MVGRRWMANGGVAQSDGGKEEAGGVDPSRHERRRGSARVAASRCRKTQAARNATGSVNPTTDAARSFSFAWSRRDSGIGARHNFGIVFTAGSAAVARRPASRGQRSSDPETRPGRCHIRCGSSRESIAHQRSHSNCPRDQQASDDCSPAGEADPTDSCNLRSAPVRLAALQLQDECAGRASVPQENAGDGCRRNPRPCRATRARHCRDEIRSCPCTAKQSGPS